jgi:hypothetical protein
MFPLRKIDFWYWMTTINCRFGMANFARPIHSLTRLEPPWEELNQLGHGMDASLLQLWHIKGETPSLLESKF